MKITDKLPPHSIEAEAAALGAILLDPASAGAAMAEVCQKLRGARPERFYDLRHQLIFSSIIDLQADAKPIDLILLSQKLSDRKQLADAGGIAYLASLPSLVASSLQAGSYAEIVHKKACLRATIAACLAFMRAIDENEENGDAAAAILETALLGASVERVGGTDQSMRELMHQTIDIFDDYHRGQGQLRGLPTGFHYMDKMLCGLAPGQVIVLAARPGMGKTSLGMNIIEHIGVNKGVPCGVISCEMIAIELALRLVFQRTGGDYQRFRTGFFEERDRAGITRVIPQLASAPIHVEDRSGLTIEDIRSVARRWVHLYQIKVLLIDYLQLVETQTQFMSREQAVAFVSRQCKAMAKELNIPVILLAQLNREYEKRKGTKPQLSDLRESGAIEQDADVVGILYQVGDDDTDPSNMSAAEMDWSRKYREVNLLIAKQRNGPQGDITLVFEKSSMRFLSFNKNTGVITPPNTPAPTDAPAPAPAGPAVVNECDLPNMD